VGKGLKTFFVIVGILATLAFVGKSCELKDPHQDRIINPSDPIHLPKINVK
jgi:hypothetical protein